MNGVSDTLRLLILIRVEDNIPHCLTSFTILNLPEARISLDFFLQRITTTGLCRMFSTVPVNKVIK